MPRTPSTASLLTRTPELLAVKTLAMVYPQSHSVLDADAGVDVVDGAHGPHGDVDAHDAGRRVVLRSVDVDEKCGRLAIDRWDERTVALQLRKRRGDHLLQRIARIGVVELTDEAVRDRIDLAHA